MKRFQTHLQHYIKAYFHHRTKRVTAIFRSRTLSSHSCADQPGPSQSHGHQHPQNNREPAGKVEHSERLNWHAKYLTLCMHGCSTQREKAKRPQSLCWAIVQIRGLSVSGHWGDSIVSGQTGRWEAEWAPSAAVQ